MFLLYSTKSTALTLMSVDWIMYPQSHSLGEGGFSKGNADALKEPSYRVCESDNSILNLRGLHRLKAAL